MWFVCNGAPPPSNATSSRAAKDTMPPQLAGVVNRCLQQDPALRYTNAVEILQDLTARVEAAPGRPGLLLPQTRYRKRIALAAALLTLMAVLISAGVRLRPEIAPTPAAPANYRVIVLPFTQYQRPTRE